MLIINININITSFVRTHPAIQWKIGPRKSLAFILKSFAAAGLHLSV